MTNAHRTLRSTGNSSHYRARDSVFTGCVARLSFLTSRDQLDPATVDEFLNQGSRIPPSAAKVGMLKGTSPEVLPAPEASQPQSDAAVIAPGLIPIHVRVRPEIAGALKTAALQRELRGIEPHTKREIVEGALEPWLKKNGYL